MTGLGLDSDSTTIKNYFSLLVKTPIRYVYSFMLSDSDRELLKIVNIRGKIINNCCAAIGIKPTTKINGHTAEQLWKWSTTDDLINLKLKYNDSNTFNKELAKRYSQDTALMNLCGKPIKPQAYKDDSKLGLKKGNTSIIQNPNMTEIKEIRENIRLTEIIFEARHLESPNDIATLKTTMTTMQEIWDSLQFNKDEDEDISNSDHLLKEEEKYLICPDDFETIRTKSFYSALVYDPLNEEIKDESSIKKIIKDKETFSAWIKYYKENHSLIYNKKWLELNFKALLCFLKIKLEKYKLWSKDDYQYLLMCLCFWNKNFTEKNLPELIKESQASSAFLLCIKEVICKKLGFKNITVFLFSGPKIRILRTEENIKDEIIEFLDKNVAQIKIKRTFHSYMQNKSKHQFFLLINGIKEAIQLYKPNNIEEFNDYENDDKAISDIKQFIEIQNDKKVIYAIINSIRNFYNLHSKELVSNKLKNFLNQLLNEYDLYVSRQEQLELLIFCIYPRVCKYITDNRQHSIFHLHHRHSKSGLRRAEHFKTYLEGLSEAINSIDHILKIESLEKNFIKEIIDFVNKNAQYSTFSGSINVNDHSLLTHIISGFIEFNQSYMNINKNILSPELEAFNRVFVRANINIQNKNSREHVKEYWRDFVS
jgi:hypothetical protein